MIVYKVSFPNKKVYIGITNGTLEGRKKRHYRDVNSDSFLLFHRALRKYQGLEVWEVIDSKENREEICAAECYYIQRYRSNDRMFGYNCTPGGDGCHGPLSEGHKEKIRIRTKAQAVFCYSIDGAFSKHFPSLADCRKNTGCDTRCIRKICNKNKSISSKGYVFGYTEEDCLERLEKYNTDYHHPDDVKKKISQTNIKTKSQNHIRIKSSIGRVGERIFYCYKLNGGFVGSFQSIAICSTELGVAESNISFCLTNVKKYAKEYVFDFNENICREKARNTKKTKFLWFIVCDGEKELYRFNRKKEASKILNIDSERIRNFLRRAKKDEFGRSYKYIEHAATPSATPAV